MGWQPTLGSLARRLWWRDGYGVRPSGRTLTLIAAVRRVRTPGCKFDELLVLESPQGLLKSSALRVLSVEESWFSDDLPLNSDGKRAIESLAGRWIVEAAELNGLRRSDIEHLKSFLSRQVDRARMSYDRLVTAAPRQCVFIGTTNSTTYLRDGTGNRRFWPVRVGRFDIEALRRDRDQLWAEAAAREAETKQFGSTRRSTTTLLLNRKRAAAKIRSCIALFRSCMICKAS